MYASYKKTANESFERVITITTIADKTIKNIARCCCNEDLKP